MHFFIDPAQLPPQAPAQAYGPPVTNSESEFRLTSQFTLTAANTAFACQEGQLLVVESNTPGQVTLILKPIGGLDVGLNAVRYYVYRGVQKASFVQGTTLRPRNPATDNSAALNLFWKSFDAAKKAQKQPNLADPLPASLVVATSVANQPIEAYFTGQPDQLPLVVKEGNSLGNFAIGTIGFEIITDTYGLTLDLDYCRRASYSVKKTNLDVLSGLAQTAARDAILSFIDPAAFYGLHAEVGVRFGTATQPLTGTALLAGGVQQFATHNRAYLDIRNECGRSYNFSTSYHDANNHDLGIGGSFTTYATAGWPLHYVDLSASSGTTVQLQLRLDSNDSPQLFCEAGRYGGPGQPLGPCFAPAADLAELSDKWTHLLPFYLPGATATYLKLHYYRPALLANPPDGVLVRRHRLDNLFDLSHLPAAPTASASVQHAFAPEPVLVTGQRAASPDAYAFVATSGIYASTDRAVCYLQERQAPENPARTDFYPPNDTGTTSPGLFSDVRAGFLRSQVALSATPLPAAGSAPIVQVANIYAYSGTPNYRESLTLLCLTAAELQALAAAPGLSPLHPRYLVFTDTTPAGGLTTDTDEACSQYSVQVLGLDANGNCTPALPTPAVTVYATATGFVLASSGLAGQLAATPAVSYKLDGEEKAGNLAFDKPTAGKKPVSVINYYTGTDSRVDSAIDIQVATIVANFKTAIQKPGITQAQLTALAKTAGQTLFTRGVAYIKEGLLPGAKHQPDDRSLYWGRIKMGIALKQHPLFANTTNLETIAGVSNGNIKPGSPLSKVVQRFEEATRNYTNVDFTGLMGISRKKILITGYDPFLIDDTYQDGFNRYQLNPSDIVAGALHNEVVGNGRALVQAMMFPVRYRDFDTSLDKAQGGPGVVERYIKKYITGLEKVDMIITISQGRSSDVDSKGKRIDYYDIEQYATATRDGFFDNTTKTLPHYPTFTTRSIPLVTPAGETWEWLETTLPSVAPPATMHTHYNSDYELDKNGDLQYSDTSPKKTDPFPIMIEKDGPLPANFPHTQQLLEGSGAAYLSNEIFYRVARLRYLYTGNTMPTGHLHLPVIKKAKRVTDVKSAGAQSGFDFPMLQDVIKNVRLIIDRMAGTL